MPPASVLHTVRRRSPPTSITDCWLPPFSHLEYIPPARRIRVGRPRSTLQRPTRRSTLHGFVPRTNLLDPLRTHRALQIRSPSLRLRAPWFQGQGHHIICRRRRRRRTITRRASISPWTCTSPAFTKPCRLGLSVYHLSRRSMVHSLFK